MNNPPLPPFQVLVKWREAGCDIRSVVYNSQTVFMLSHMNYQSISQFLARSR